MRWKTVKETPAQKIYENTSPNPLKRIELYGHPEQFCEMEMEFAYRSAHNNFCLSFANTSVPIKWSQTNSPTATIPITTFTYTKGYVSTPYSDLKECLQGLLKLDPSFKYILPQVCDYLKISPALGVNLEQLKLLSVQDAITEAIEMQNNGHFDLIWELLNYYNDDSLKVKKDNASYLVTSQELYDLASAISENNPHYKEAQDKCVEILMQVAPPVTPKEVTDDLELRICLHNLNKI